MTDQEINELVARKLGWTRCNDEDEGEIRWHIDKPLEPGTFGGQCVSALPDYCHDIAAAWEIVDWLYAHDWGFRINRASGPNEQFSVDLWHVTPGQGGGSIMYGDEVKDSCADIASAAICSAFLKIP